MKQSRRRQIFFTRLKKKVKVENRSTAWYSNHCYGGRHGRGAIPAGSSYLDIIFRLDQLSIVFASRRQRRPKPIRSTWV